MIELSRQSQVIGDRSTAVQAQNVTIVQADRVLIERIAKEVIEREMSVLSARAYETFRNRAEALVQQFIDQLSVEGGFNRNRVEDPRFQVALLDAQKEYGKDGSSGLKDQLTNLLVRMNTEPQDEITKLYAEAIKVVPLLTRAQVNAIATVCTFRYLTYSVHDIDELNVSFQTKVFPFLNGAARSAYDFSHIEYTRCGQIGVGSFSPIDAMLQTYRGLFSKGFQHKDIPATVRRGTRKRFIIPCLNDPRMLQINCLNIRDITKYSKELGLEEIEVRALTKLLTDHTLPENEIFSALNQRDERFMRLADYVLSTDAKHLTLTSVGFIVGVVNMENVSGEKVDLGGWFSA
jgi:hypothetical protein